MVCNLYIEQIERAGGNLLGTCSCGQPVGNHIHEPKAPAPGIYRVFLRTCTFHTSLLELLY